MTIYRLIFNETVFNIKSQTWNLMHLKEKRPIYQIWGAIFFLWRISMNFLSKNHLNMLEVIFTRFQIEQNLCMKLILIWNYLHLSQVKWGSPFRWSFITSEFRMGEYIPRRRSSGRYTPRYIKFSEKFDVFILNLRSCWKIIFSHKSLHKEEVALLSGTFSN